MKKLLIILIIINVLFSCANDNIVNIIKPVYLNVELIFNDSRDLLEESITEDEIIFELFIEKDNGYTSYLYDYKDNISILVDQGKYNIYVLGGKKYDDKLFKSFFFGEYKDIAIESSDIYINIDMLGVTLIGGINSFISSVGAILEIPIALQFPYESFSVKYIGLYSQFNNILIYNSLSTNNGILSTNFLISSESTGLIKYNLYTGQSFLYLNNNHINIISSTNNTWYLKDFTREYYTHIY